MCGSPKHKSLRAQETEGVAGKVRAAKSREAALRQEGMTGQRAGRAAAASVATAKKLPTKQKKKRAAGSKAAAPNERCTLLQRCVQHACC